MYNLVEELKQIVKVLEGRGMSYALCGGMAVSVYGEPRGTIDIDLVVPPEELEQIAAALAPLGFEKNSAPMPLGGGQMPIQRLIKFGKGEPDVLMLDLCMPDKNKFPEVWKGWIKARVEDTEIWTLSIPGLIQMKKSRGSHKDLADIEALEKKHP